jgi:hypothetical protein
LHFVDLRRDVAGLGTGLLQEIIELHSELDAPG